MGKVQHLIALLCLVSAALLIVGDVASAQCPPFVPPQDSVSGSGSDLVIEAALLITCCAQCTQNDDIQDAADSILEKLEAGNIRSEAGDDTWMAYTAADTQCSTHSHWTSDPGNSIVLNSTFFPDDLSGSDDAQAAAAILAGMLAHEYLHCHTFVNSQTLAPPRVWDNPCGLYSNEVLCHAAEELVLNCIVTCGCVTGMSAGGTSDVGARLDKVGEWKKYFGDQFVAENC